MKIAYNPLGSGAYIPAPDNKDIIFDLVTRTIYAKGVPFDGTKYSTFKKHTSPDNTGGSEGLVPIPSYSTTNTRLLREDGLWVNVAGVSAPDDHLSTESTNSVENRVIAEEFEKVFALLILKAENVYKIINVGGINLVASGANDILEFVQGDGILLLPSEINKSITISTRAIGLLGIDISYNSGQLIAKVADTYFNRWNLVFNWYTSVTEEDTDGVINKWQEIVDFVDSVAEGTDITDEFVTRKTNLTITGVKTFNTNGINTTIENGTVRHYISTDGGWARGFSVSNTSGNTTVIGSFGVYGEGVGTGDNRIEYLYASHQDLNYDNAVLKIYKDRIIVAGHEVYHKGNLKNLSDLNNDLYWANIPVSTTSSTTTTPTFANTNINGILNINSGSAREALTIDSTNLTGAIVRLCQDGTPKMWYGYSPGLGGVYYFNENDTGIFLKNNNNVGISTTNPKARLHVLGSSTDFTLPVGLTENNATGQSWYAVHAFTNPSMSTGEYTAIQIGKKLNTNNCGHLSFYYAGDSSNANRFALGFYNAIDLLVVKANGNIGIGTVSPTAKLHVFKTTNLSYTDSAFFQDNGTSVPHQCVNITFGKSQTKYNLGYIGHAHVADGSSNNYVTIGGYSSDRLLNILYNGNVGIGTTTPFAKLHILGSTWIDAGSYIANRATLILNSNGAPADVIFKNQSSTKGNYGYWALSSRSGESSTRFSIFRGAENANNKSELELFTLRPDGDVDIKGTINLWNTTCGQNHDEGIRIHPSSSGWSALVFCGTDNTGDTGTSAKTWGIYTYNGNIYINKNTSNANTATNATLCNVNNNWGVGTISPTSKLHVVGSGHFYNPNNRNALLLSSADGRVVLSFLGTGDNEWSHIGTSSDKNFYAFNWEAYRNDSTGVTSWGITATNDFYIGKSGVPESNRVLTINKSGATFNIPINASIINEISGTNGLLAYHPSGWTGVTSSQWVVGTVDSLGVLRSNNSDLLHYKGGTLYPILDSSNWTNYSPKSTVWIASTTVNAWRRILTISGYSNILLSMRWSLSSQASLHLYLISTGFNAARIVQLGYNGYAYNYAVLVRVTYTDSGTFHVEVYNSYGYNGATTISVGCRATVLDTNSSITTITANTAGGGTIGSSLTSSNTIASNFNSDMLDGYHESKFPLLNGVKSGTWNWNDVLRAGYYKILAGTITNHPSGIYNYGMAAVLTTENHADGENRELLLYYPHNQTDSIAIWGRMHNSGTQGNGWGPWWGIPNTEGVKKIINTYYWANVPVSATSSTTTSPTFANATMSGILTFTTAGDTAKIKFLNGEFIDGYGNVLLGTNSASWNVLDSSRNRLLAVLKDGNVGIGTGSPGDKLHVNGGYVRIVANGKYLKIGPQNASHAHYETDATLSHWFNKRVDVNGAIWLYNTNYGIAADGKFYAHTVYANRPGGSTVGGISLFSDSDPMTYGIAFRGTGTYGTHGYVTGDWATYFTMSNTENRGWIFRRAGSGNIFSIDCDGHAYANGLVNASQFNSRVATGTQPYACTSTTLNTNLNADLLDGYHEYSFLRYRDNASTDGTGTLWGQIGIRSYHKALPDGLTGVYNYGQVVSLPGSGSRLDIFTNHVGSSESSGQGGLWWRSGWNDDKKTWRRIIDSGNIGSQSVNYATSSGSANWLNTNSTLTYGASGLNYFNINGTAGNTKANNTPTSAWYHILRMNHANSGGYLADIAIPLNDVNGIYWRLIRNGGFYGWYKLLDSNNYSGTLDGRYIKKAGDTLASGTALIQRAGSSVSWYLGRSNAMFRINSFSGYNAIASLKTANGDWSLGVYVNNILYFTYITDTNFNSAQNTVTALIYMNPSGHVYATHFYEHSDINLKTNIEAITTSDNIPQLKSFDWKSDGSHSYGLIAQELEAMGYSELVSEEGGLKTVKYSAALSLIVGKLQVKIKELEKEIENLKNKN